MLGSCLLSPLLLCWFMASSKAGFLTCLPDTRAHGSLSFVLLPGRWMTRLSSAGAGPSLSRREKRLESKNPAPVNTRPCCFLSLVYTLSFFLAY